MKKQLQNTKKQFFQEFWADDVVNLLVDIDDKHCPTEEAMYAKTQLYSDWVLATCAEKLKMTSRDVEEQVAISASPGQCINYYPEPVEDGEGSVPVWKLVEGSVPEYTTKDPASASPQELKRYFRYKLSKKEKEAGKTEADARFNKKYETVRYKAGIHAVINGFTCRFGSQFDYFTQEGWVGSCPKQTNGEDSLDNIYSSRRLLRMLNNEKMDTDKRPKVATTLSQSLMKHVPSVFDGKPQKNLTANIVPPKTPEKLRQEKVEIKQKKEKIEKGDTWQTAVKTSPGQSPAREEVEYLLYSIDCDGERGETFLPVANFMKFSCTFDDRRDMFEEWADGGWEKPDGTVTDSHERGSRNGWWDGEKKDLGYDIGYLRVLAKKAAWGRKRLAEFENNSLIRTVLGVDTFQYDPQFGQVDVAELVLTMCPPIKYDDRNTTANEGLFKFNESTGIWQATEKNWLKRFI